MIHPFDDPYVIAGQGTVGMEILKGCVGKGLDAIFVCCGGTVKVMRWRMNLLMMTVTPSLLLAAPPNTKKFQRMSLVGVLIQ